MWNDNILVGSDACPDCEDFLDDEGFGGNCDGYHETDCHTCFAGLCDGSC